MEPSELLQKLVGFLERAGIPYLVTGSMATIAYGEPRMTNDIDVVIALPPERIDDFCAAFPEADYYLSADAVREAVRERRQFNIIHPTSGLKIDVMIPSETDFNRSRFARGLRIPTGAGVSATFASPEDVIVKKLQYFREGGSEKHVRDILGVLKIRGAAIDREYIRAWSIKLGVGDQWELVTRRESAK